MGCGIDVHQARDQLRQHPHVALRRVHHTSGVAMFFVTVDKQLHFQSLHVAVHELQDWRGQAGYRCLCEIVLAVHGVFFRIEQHRDAQIVDRVGDRRLFECHGLAPSHPLALGDQAGID